MRPDEQDRHHHQVGRQVADAPAEEGEVALVAGGERLGDADDESPGERPGGGVESAEDRGGERLERGERRGALQTRGREHGEEEGGDGGEGSGDRPGGERDPPQLDAHERRRLRVLGGCPHRHAPRGVAEGEQEHRDQQPGGEERGDPGLGEGDASDGDDLVAPGVSEGEHVRAHPASEFGDQEDVDADGDDGQDALVAAPVAAHHEELDARPDGRRSRDPDEQRGPEPDVVVEHGGDVAARQQQGRVREVDDLGGLEDDDEPERDECVDRADRQAAEEEFDERGH